MRRPQTRPRSLRLLAAAAPVALAPAALIACPTPHHKSPATPGYEDGLGRSAAWSGALLLVGAPGRDAAASNAGAVYMFSPGSGTWNQSAEILAADAAAGDAFGRAVAFSDPYAVIGAPGAGAAGAVYFFERSGNTWTQKTRVTPTSQSGANVGEVLAMSGATAAVGIPNAVGGDQDQYAAAGKVVVYQRTGTGAWGATQVINEDAAQEPVAGDRLGQAVALGGELLVIGVPFGENLSAPENHGYAGIFRRVGSMYEFEQHLNAPTLNQGDIFGASVATDGQYVAIGSPWYDRTAADGGVLNASGCVYVYRRDGAQWVLDAKVLASDAAATDAFGGTVAIKNGRLVVGAEEADKVYVFRRVDGTPAVWIQDLVITDPTPATDSFADAVAFNGDQIAIGEADDTSPFTPVGGAVYIYNRPNFAHSDLCAGAVPLSQGTFTGCTDGAAREYTASCGGAPLGQGPDVWFSWTSGCTGTLTLDTNGSDFNTVLSVLTGCPGDPDIAQIACNNDAAGQGLTSRLSFNYEPNRTYYVRLGGVSGGAGSYVLTVTDGNGNPPANNSCSGAQDVADGTYNFSTCRAGGGLGIPGCDGQSLTSLDHEVWFRYTAPRTGTATVDLCGSNFPAAVAVHAQAHCPSFIDAPLACSLGGDCPEGQASVQFPVSQGQQYFIRVGSPGGLPGGNAQMVISSGSAPPACPADWDANGQVNSSDISAFLTAWLASLQGGDLDADFNADQAVNSTDISAFLAAWLQAVQQSC